MNNNRLFKYILSTMVIAVLFVLAGTVSVYARTEDQVTSGTSVEVSTEETTAGETVTEVTTESTTKLPSEPSTEITTQTTTRPTTETTTQTTTRETATETTTKQIAQEPSTETTTRQITQETSTEATTKAPVRSSGGGGSSKSCRVTFQSGEMGKIGNTTSVSVVINKGTAPKTVPKVTPKAGVVFVGWTKNGVTITDPAKVPLYSNTVYTAVYKEKSGLDRLLNIGGILDKLGL